MLTLKAQTMHLFAREFLKEVEKEAISILQGGIILRNFLTIEEKNKVGFIGQPLEIEGDLNLKHLDATKIENAKNIRKELEKEFKERLFSKYFQNTSIVEGRNIEVFINLLFAGKLLEIKKGFDENLKIPAEAREIFEKEFDTYTLVFVRGGRKLKTDEGEYLIDVEFWKYPLVLSKDKKVYLVKDFVNIAPESLEGIGRNRIYTLAIEGKDKVLYVCDVSLRSSDWIKRYDEEEKRFENITPLRYYFPLI